MSLSVRRGALVAVIASLALLGAAASADRWAPTARPVVLEAPTTSASPSSVTLACPPGVTDSFNTSRSAPASIWSTTGLGASDAAPSTVSAEGADTVPTAVIVAGQGGGELIGLSATGCAVPQTDQWIAAGSTTLGEDIVLVLANPSKVASVAEISGYGGAGLLDTTPQRVTVPAESAVTVLPAGFLSDQERLALRIRADGTGVAVWAQVSGMDGEVPRGSAWASAVKPTTSTVFLGVTDSSSLRIAVPGDEAASVAITVSTDEGEAPLPPGSVTVDGGTVLDVPVTGASGTSAAIVAVSDQPIVASIAQSTPGAEWPESSTTWTSRSVIAPAMPVTRIDLPGTDELTALVKRQLSARPLRATSIATDSGVTGVSASLMILAPTSQGIDAAPVEDEPQSGGESSESARPEMTTPLEDGPQSAASGALDPVAEEISIRVGDRVVSAAVGSTITLDLPTGPTRVSSTAPVRMAVLITAQTPAGPVKSVWPIGTVGVATQEATISVID